MTYKDIYRSGAARVVRQITIDPAWWAEGIIDNQPIRQVLAQRKISSLFQFLHARGWSWSAIAAATGLTENRTREIAAGQRHVVSYDVLERIALGLQIPRAYMGLGLAFTDPDEASHDSHQRRVLVPSPGRRPNLVGTGSQPDKHIASDPNPGLSALRAALGLSHTDATTLAGIAADVIELDVGLDIDIDEDGAARLRYQHRLLNIGSRPVTRLTREVWFKHTGAAITIRPEDVDETRVAIQRVHDTPTLAKFACQLSPALLPGQVALVAYTVEGGHFVDEFYWRQATPRYVQRMDIRLRHRGAGRLRSCIATEEHPDGSENSAAERLRWDYEGSDIVVGLTVGCLRPNQAVTLRWEFDREAA